MGFFPKIIFRRQFMKKTVFFGLLVIILVFGFIGCDNGNGGGDDEFTVTFDLDGGKIGESIANVTRSVKTGETVSDLPNPTKENNSFGGWFTQKNGLGNEFNEESVVISNLTVFAKWLEIENGFTLIDIPSEYNGKYALVISAGNDNIFLAGAQNIDEDGLTAILISNQRVSIPMILFNEDDTLESYSGNDTVELFLIITNLPTFSGFEEGEEGTERDPNLMVIYWYLESITFTDGNATKSWNDGEVIELDE
jgi:hypothetical protein